MRVLPILIAATLAGAAPAQAAQVFFENFNGENGGAYASNYTGFSKFIVTNGNVDIVPSGSFGVVGDGSFVDLDGSPDAGSTDGSRLQSRNAFSFAAGDTVSLRFLVGGSQRGDSNEFSFGFETTGGNILFNNAMVGGTITAGVVPIGDLNGPAFSSGRPFGLGLVLSNEPFSPYSLTFTAGNAGTVNFFFAAPGPDDSSGVLLDDVSLDITPAATAVPEPATWGLMLLGFGLAGAALRRRATLATAATA